VGRFPRAARLFGAEAARRAAAGARVLVGAPEEYEHDLARTRAALEEGAFGQAWAEGQSWTLEQAIAYALDDQAE
jgi:hypothetical protein